MPHTSPEASLLKATAEFGSVFVTNTSAYTGEFWLIQAVTDCKFSTLSSTNMENVSAWTTGDRILYAGMALPSQFTHVQLLSGSAMLYKH